MEMKVSTKTHPKRLGKAIFNAINESGSTDLICIGGGAVNVANKAMIFAKGLFAENGISVSLEPSFTETEVPDRGRIVAIRWKIQKA